MIEVEKHQEIKRNALLYAEHGFKIVPVHGVIPDPDAKGTKLCTCGDPDCEKIGKHPRISEWQRKASNDQTRIRSWFERWPDMNYGIIPGNGVFVLDVDERNGGFDTLRELESQYGKLPLTLTVMTGNGIHFYFSYDSKKHIVLWTEKLKGIDVKGDTNGYVIGPGSMHENGKTYRFASQETSLGNTEIAKTPEWLLKMISSDAFVDKVERNLNTTSVSCDISSISAGKRNKTLMHIAGKLWNKGLNQEEIEESLLQVNENLCSPPLGKHEVREIAKSIAKYERHPSYPLTDLGNSQRFVNLHKHRIRYCGNQKIWYIWNDIKWEQDNQNKIQELAKETANQMLQEALLISDSAKRNELVNHAKKCQSKASINNLIDLANSHPDINVIDEDFDKDHFLLNVKNGTINLKTGKLLPHDPKNLITKFCNVEYDESATCPKFHGFIDYIFAGNHDLINYIQKLVGYCLTGSTEEQILPILYGNGNNGKSTFMQVIQGLFGDYAISADTTSFSASNNSTIRCDLARMKEARVVLTTEFESNQHISEALIKRITGGESIECRKLYKDPFEYLPTFTILMATNHRPEIKGTDEGIWRRIHLIPFTVKIADKDRKKNYAKELMKELPGILNWALEGCLKWQREGLEKPSPVKAATTDYRNDMDELGEFLKVVCNVSDEARILSSELYAAYTSWCESNGIRVPQKNRSFSLKLKERGFETVHRSTGNEWQGIELKEEVSPDSVDDSSIADFFG